jgi:hypothetical protein
MAMQPKLAEVSAARISCIFAVSMGGWTSLLNLWRLRILTTSLYPCCHEPRHDSQSQHAVNITFCTRGESTCVCVSTTGGAPACGGGDGTGGCWRRRPVPARALVSFGSYPDTSDKGVFLASFPRNITGITTHSRAYMVPVSTPLVTENDDSSTSQLVQQWRLPWQSRPHRPAVLLLWVWVEIGPV